MRLYRQLGRIVLDIIELPTILVQIDQWNIDGFCLVIPEDNVL